jgi:2'-5' RNA ligase
LRIFLAMDLSEEVRRNLATLSAELSPAAPGARWIRAEAMHITLKFIGHAAENRVEQIKNSLATVRSAAPVEMRFRGAGCFPNVRRPRVLWVGIESSPNLPDLASEIERCLEPLGVPREERVFHPHLTLARFKEPSAASRLPTIVKGLASREFGAMLTGEFYLYQSELKSDGAEYTRLTTFRFFPQ